jgi:hypothetical protein
MELISAEGLSAAVPCGHGDCKLLATVARKIEVHRRALAYDASCHREDDEKVGTENLN